MLAAWKRHGVTEKKHMKLAQKLYWRNSHRPKDWTNLLLLFWYPDTATYQYYYPKTILGNFPEVEQMLIVSYTVRYAQIHGLSKLSISNKHKHRAVLVGADDSEKTKEQLREERSEVRPFVEGFLYKRYREKLYAPAMINEDATFFEPTLDDDRNDCLLHSINNALWCPWFVAWE